MNRRALILLLALTPGCSFFTVDAKSGSKALPIDLRSSADTKPPVVARADVPSTQPSGALQSVTSAAVSIPDQLVERLTVDRFKEAARNLKSPDADIRRVSLNRVAARSYGRGLPYTDVYRTTAQFDSDGLVRATAIRTINRVRDTESGAVLVAALADGDPQVRLEACKALANLPTPAAEQPLRAIAQDGNADQDLRIAALDALRHYNSLDTARLLVSQLNSNVFSLSWQSRRSLFLMTGQDHRYDEGAWLNYFAAR